MSFDGKSVLVTGGGAGMGRAIVDEFVDGGASVAFLDIDPDRVRETLAVHEGVVGLVGDVADPGDVARFVSTAVAEFGGVDVVCNNAGILGEGPTAETSLDIWDRVVAVNLTGVFLMCRAAIPEMLKGGGGAIVNTASVAAFVGGAGDAVYTATKHGVVGLTRSIAVEYGQQGIRANAICPGATATPMTLPNRPSEGAGPYDDFIAATPAGRWARPEEMARLVRYLASDDADFVHGAAWCIDGGWSTS